MDIIEIYIIFEVMYYVLLKKSALFIGFLLMSILLMQFVWNVSDPDKKKEKVSAEKLNLALRRTAHQLLKEAGDSTSRIIPVEKINDNVWLLKLEHTFSYNRLPAILKTSFDIFKIDCNYDVAILSCSDGKIQLGYNFLDFSQNNNIPCAGRDLAPGCYNIQLTVSAGGKSQSNLPIAGWFFSCVLAVTLYSLGRKWYRPSEKVKPERPIEADWLYFGHSRLNVMNQQLICGDKSNQLTFRETKLLNLFVLRPNQILDRSFILNNVWADEGILVGRSIDMFVSRLRKMLRDDQSVQLVAVHGVGYKLEIA